jgi:glutamate racemase
VENGLLEHPAAEMFIREYTQKILAKDPQIDALLLGCTHYPLLKDVFLRVLPKNVKALSQGTVIAQKTMEYLAKHKEIDRRISKNSKIRFLTTDSAEFFEKGAAFFWDFPIEAERVNLLYSSNDYSHTD